MSKGGGSSGGGNSAQQAENLRYAAEVANKLDTRQFADFTPQYLAGEQQITRAAQGGAGMRNLDTAANLTQASTGYSPMMVGDISAGPASLADSTGYTASQFGGAQADMGNISQYYNPYQQDVIDATMADLEKGRQTAAQQIGQQATAARAFGGSRQGVAESLSNANFAEQAGRTISQLRAQGFDTAANLMQQDVARQQQAGLANQGALNTASQFGAGASNQAALANQAAMNQMNQFNAGLGMQGQLANQQADLSGAQFRLNAANQLGNMGQQQTAQQYAAGQALMGLGGARQDLQQQRMDAERNLNMERMNIWNSAQGLGPTVQPTYQNTGANVLGGALGGAQLAGLLPASMGVTAGMGALGGALLGLI